MSDVQERAEREEIERDRRRERRLVWQALIALAIVAVLVMLREWLLR